MEAKVNCDLSLVAGVLALNGGLYISEKKINKCVSKFMMGKLMRNRY